LYAVHGHTPCAPATCLFANRRQQLADEQQQAEATAISSTYPLARAARLLGNWTEVAEQQLGTAPGSKSPRNGSSRPWPCFDASKPQRQQQQQPPQKQQRDVGHALSKPVAEWSPEQCAAAASAAAAWVGELARGQQLLAAALQRAEQAEMELAAVKLDGAAGSSNTLCLAHTPTTAVSTGVRALPSGSSSPRQQQGWQPGSVVAAGIAAASDHEQRAQLSAVQQELAAARTELRAAR
jgi:hypothetical protein